MWPSALGGRSSSPSNSHRLPHLVPVGIAFVLATCLPLSPNSLAHAQAPKAVGGFAICQTLSSLHIQGGVVYSDDETHLTLSNQHFRLDLSQGFSTNTPPTWVNLTTKDSPYQAYHAGACTTDQQSFLMVGNAMVASGSKTGFMRAYSLEKGSWSVVDKVENKPESAGRTMVGFAIGGGVAGHQPSSSFTTANGKKAMGLVIGGGLMKMSAATVSSPATKLTEWMSDINLVTLGMDGNLDSLQYTTPQGGNGDNGRGGSLLGTNAATNVIVLPGDDGGSKALILGGLSSEKNGLSFSRLPVVDLTTGAVTSDGKTVVMFGGAPLGSDKPSNEVHVLDIQTWTWSQPSIKGSLPAGVRNHQCIMVGDQLITLYGFNQNGVPFGASSSMLNVLSTSQWSWDNNFTPLRNTPPPPPPPGASDESGKPNGLAIGFGVVFSLAFLSVIVYSVWAHQKRKLKKRELLLLVELDRQKKNTEQEKKKVEKLQQQQEQQQQDPQRESQVHLTGAAHYGTYHSHDYGGQEYNPYYASTVAVPATTAPYQHTQYSQHDMYNHPLVNYSSTNQYPDPSYAGYTQTPVPPQVPPKPGQEGAFIPEEMGSSSYETSARRGPPGPQVLVPHPHYAGAATANSAYRDSTRFS
ncbi:hypothetical protein BGZ73_006396 [Actinomortierella ambigua]|nr:hypothetical protein BGZ73_006396 [Actinomortierella ambigua]